MLKKIVFTAILLASILGFSQIDLQARNTGCDYTYQYVVIGPTTWLYTYDCNGALVNVTEIDE